MNLFKRFVIASTSFVLVSCGSSAETAPPPLFIMEEPILGNQNFVNFSIDEITILGKAGDPVGLGEFRVLIIGADTEGRSSGTYCPGNEPIKIRTGSTVKSPCLFTIGFDEKKVGNGVFLMVLVVDEDNSSLGGDLSYEIVAHQLGDSLGKAVAKGIFKLAGKSNPVTITVSVLTSFLGGKVKDWLEKADMIGTQGILLSRADNWSAGKSTTITSGDGGMRFTYSVTYSTTGPGPAPKTAIPPTQPKPSSTSRPTSAPLAIATSQASDAEQFLQNYFRIVTEQRDYELGWSLLTPAFRQKNSPGGFNEYVEFWDKIRSVELNSIEFYEESSLSTKCLVNITFYSKTLSQTVDVRYHLIYNSSRRTWLFETP